jgi:DNA polymerase V
MAKNKQYNIQQRLPNGSLCCINKYFFAKYFCINLLIKLVKLMKPSTFTIYTIAGNELPTMAKPFYELPIGITQTIQYQKEEINLNNLLSHQHLHTFVIQAKDNAMKDAAIHTSALLVVNQQIKPTNNKIIVALVNNEILVRRYIKNSSGIRLMPANEAYKPMPITDNMQFTILGTVTNIIVDALVG